MALENVFKIYEPALKDCPFCGGVEPILVDKPSSAHMECMSCGAKTQAHYYRPGMSVKKRVQACIDDWNRRVSESNLTEIMNGEEKEVGTVE